MANFNGNFQYTDQNGNQQQGPCQIEFDKKTFTLASASAAPLSFDLGDIDGIVSERHQLRLTLYTGALLLLNQFGSSYDNLVQELTKVRLDREVQCLLLADMPELARFPGHFERIAGGMRCNSCGAAGMPGKFCRNCGKPIGETAAPATSVCPACGARGQQGKFCRECGHGLQSDSAAQPVAGDAEIRLHKTNIAVLPELSPGFQIRLADMRQLVCEAGGYNVLADLGNEAMKFSGLGRRTAEFGKKVGGAISAMLLASGQALHTAFPFLTPDQLQRLAALLPEGSSAAVAELGGIDPRISDALVKNAVDKDLQPYYQELLGRSVSGSVYAGFKLIRPEEQESKDAVEPDESEAVDADEKGPDALYWFFFPLEAKSGKPHVVAWEASSRGGRATYFFRIDERSDLNEQIHRLNRGLAILNFRRRPIYLSDAELAMNPTFRRYAIAARRIPEVRQLRSAFLGRAMHSSVEAWQEQVKRIVESA